MSGSVETATFIAFLSAAALRDARTHRIPNALTVGGFLAALALRAAAGWPAVLDGLAAAGLALAVALPLLALRAFGGGDAKLLVATSAFLGPEALAPALLFTALAGGVLALVATVRVGMLPVVLSNCGALVIHLLTLGRRGRRPRLRGPAALTVPYGLAIAVGSLIAWTLAGGRT